MKVQKFTSIALASFAAFVVVFLGAAQTGAAQQGPAAKGGSLTRTRIDDAGPSTSRKDSRAKADDPEQSRWVVESLSLDFNFLAAEYRTAQKKAPALRFETAVVAALAANSQRPQAVEATTHALITEMAKKKTLAEALQIVFNLSEAQALRITDEADARLSQAKKLITEPRSR